MPNLYGFSFLKDGERYDYPYKEMLTCMSSLVEKCYLALGKNDDGTSEQVKNFSKVEVIPTVWDMSKIGDGGLIFSEQTNIALSKLREEHQSENGAWAIYLQSDEIIHENDFDKLRSDIETANAQGCDAIRFRYFHFWMDHYTIATNKRWYPCEIRAIKVDSDVVNHGDAQGFSGFKKVYESDVHIYHYGHVRDQQKREEKQKDLISKIRPKEKFAKYLNRENKAFSKTTTLPIRVHHSKVMKERIEKMGQSQTPKEMKELWIVGDSKNYSEDFLNSLNISKIHWCESVEEVPFEKRERAMVIEAPSFFQRLQWSDWTPRKMESDLARDWKRETLLQIKVASLNNQ